MSKREQYQGQPAEGFKPLAEWGRVEALSSEELEAWKRSPVERLESRVIATLADLERQLAEVREVREVIKRKNLTAWHVGEMLDRILSKEGK